MLGKDEGARGWLVRLSQKSFIFEKDGRRYRIYTNDEKTARSILGQSQFQKSMSQFFGKWRVLSIGAQWLYPRKGNAVRTVACVAYMANFFKDPELISKDIQMLQAMLGIIETSVNMESNKL
jgi:hypothetical protein